MGGSCAVHLLLLVTHVGRSFTYPGTGGHLGEPLGRSCWAQWASLGFLGLGSEISELLGTSYWVQRPIPRDLLLKQRVTDKSPPWWRARGWRGLCLSPSARWLLNHAALGGAMLWRHVLNLKLLGFYPRWASLSLCSR